MLTIGDGRSHVSRRGFLRVGGLGSLSLAGMSHFAHAAQAHLLKGKSVVFVFLHGGPSQIETFDPKMTAPSEICSTTGELKTRLPGITFGGTFPLLAERADRMSIVRSFASGDGRHDIKPIVCKDTLDANLGSIYSRVVGANHPKTGMPTNAMLFPRSVDESTQAGNMNFGKFTSTGAFGAAFAPFVPGAGGDLQEDMQLRLSLDRLGDRRTLLRRLDRLQTSLDTSGFWSGLDRMRSQAFETVLGGVAEAFDLSKEDPRTVDGYDTAPLVRPDQIDKKWNNYNNYVDNSKALGKLMLLARRLVERGCGFVTVTTNFVWDMHSDVNNAGVAEGMGYMGRPLDHAVSTFMDDLRERGMDDDVLLVVTGEMGRTPRINQKGGRDHWGSLTPLMVSGGGLQMGQVIGQSTRNAGEPLSEGFANRHLIATILHTLFDVGELRIAQRVPNDLARSMTEYQPIPGLL